MKTYWDSSALVGAVVLLSVAINVQKSLAQGTVLFNNNIPGIVVTRVYNAKEGVLYQSGLGPNDTPSGGTDWAGWIPVSGS